MSSRLRTCLDPLENLIDVATQLEMTGNHIRAVDVLYPHHPDGLYTGDASAEREKPETEVAMSRLGPSAGR